MKRMYVQEIIDYIETHIEDEIKVDDIAEYIGYSKYYLNKIFAVFTGMSLMFYVKKRKLEFSMIDLQTNDDIIDIAFKYCFNSRRAYSRLFTSFHGASPSNYRNNTYSLSPKLIINYLEGDNMKDYLSIPFIKELGPLYVLSQTVISANPEDEVIARQNKYKQTHKLSTVIEVGFDVPVQPKQEKQGIRGYEYWLCISKEDYENHNDENIKKLVVPKKTYVSLTILDPFNNPFESIPTGWKVLSSYVIENYQFDNQASSCGLEHVEEVDGKTVMNLYVPIKK